MRKSKLKKTLFVTGNEISTETRYNFFEMVYNVCHMTNINVEAISPIRNIKDIYLLSMAESVPEGVALGY